MPNTLAHVGAQGLITRAVLPGADLRWIYLGVVIPDFPWILQRAVLFAAPTIDPFLFRSYVIIQASLIGCLVLCAAVALLSRVFWMTFAILGGNVVLHLLLDAMQTKWANGAHLMAPFSWELTSWELFWPESFVTYGLTFLGLAYIIWHFRPAIKEKLDVVRPEAARALGMVVLLVGYFALPFLLLKGPIEADTHYLNTLRDGSDRTGSFVEIDRAGYVYTEDGPVLTYYGGAEQVKVEDFGIEAPATVSVRGIFVADDTVVVTQYHVHAGWFRDNASYLGLALILVIWLGAIANTVLPRSRMGRQWTGS